MVSMEEQQSPQPPSATPPPPEEEPGADLVGQEFVRQYYTVLNKAPNYLHRFYSHDSIFVRGHGNNASNIVTGQLNIQKALESLDFENCCAKIASVQSHRTQGDGVVVQVVGELSNSSGTAYRKFLQTFVLSFQAPKKYYVHNDIFQYLDDVFNKEGINEDAALETGLQSRQGGVVSNGVNEDVGSGPRGSSVHTLEPHPPAPSMIQPVQPALPSVYSAQVPPMQAPTRAPTAPSQPLDTVGGGANMYDQVSANGNVPPPAAHQRQRGGSGAMAHQSWSSTVSDTPPSWDTNAPRAHVPLPHPPKQSIPAPDLSKPMESQAMSRHSKQASSATPPSAQVSCPPESEEPPEEPDHKGGSDKTWASIASKQGSGATASRSAAHSPGEGAYPQQQQLAQAQDASMGPTPPNGQQEPMGGAGGGSQYQPIRESNEPQAQSAQGARNDDFRGDGGQFHAHHSGRYQPGRGGGTGAMHGSYAGGGYGQQSARDGVPRGDIDPFSLFVRNLPQDAGENEVKEILNNRFSGIRISGVNIRNNGQNVFGFIKFENMDDPKRILKSLDGGPLMIRESAVYVMPRQSDRDRRQVGGPQFSRGGGPRGPPSNINMGQKGMSPGPNVPYGNTFRGQGSYRGRNAPSGRGGMARGAPRMQHTNVGGPHVPPQQFGKG